MTSDSNAAAANNRIWIENWMTQHSVIILVATLLSFFFQLHWVLFGASLLSFIYFYYKHWQVAGSFRFAYEPANLVSGFRLFGLVFLFGFYELFAFRQIAVLTLLILILDGLDGYLARKYNTASDFGAYLDMETDAFFVMALTYLIVQLDLMPLWVIVLGLIRYIYFLLIRWWKPPERKERRSFLGQFIAVFLMGSLVSCFLLPKEWYTIAMNVAGILIAYSFGRDFLFTLLHATK